MPATFRRPCLDRVVKIGAREGADFVGAPHVMAAEYLPAIQSEEGSALGIPIAADAGRFTIRYLLGPVPGWLLETDEGKRTRIRSVEPIGRREYLEIDAAGAAV